MEIILILILVPVLVGATMCRWTAVHPLVCGAIVWLIAAIAILLVLAGFMVANVWAVAPVITIVPALAAMLGGFLGWLRRTHIERIG